MKKFVVALALLACFASQVIYAEKTAEEEKRYRLTSDAVPKSYEITLTMTETDANELNPIFEGDVKITFEEVKGDTIRLHYSNGMKITDITYCGKAFPKPKTRGKFREDNPNISYDIDTEIMTLNIKDFCAPASDDKVLEIVYNSKLSEDMYGFYISKFTDNDKKVHTIATTQFQTTYARRAFPCLDEPSLKAKFDITIKHPTGYIAKSNQKVKTEPSCPNPGDVCTTVFETTPSMSTYLIAFIVYHKDSIECEKVIKATPALVVAPMEVCAPKHLKDSMTYAMKQSEAILNQLDIFTGIKYDEMHKNNLDQAAMKGLNQVAIPDFAAGAMENWGLVTYRETALLHDSVESTKRDHQRISSVIAHEFAHMWFGNLVTLNWWSSSWLNEGFARYFEYHAINELEVNWRMADQFVIEQMHSIFQQDVTGALPLTSQVYTQSGIKAKFGSITYNKGACIIRMLERALHDESCKVDDCQYFRKGIREYLAEYKYKDTTPELLFKKIITPANSILTGRVEDFMTKWTIQTGYPVVKVSIVNNKLVFEQELFKYATDDTTKTTWLIPVTYHFAGEKNTQILLEGDKKEIETELTEEQKAAFVVVNDGQTGYYRVHYSSDLMNKLSSALAKEDFGKISDINRAQIVDNNFNLARVGKVDYADLLKFITFLKKDESYFSWYAAFNGFSYLRRRIPEGDLKKNITNELSTLMTNVYNKVNTFEIAGSTGQIDVYKKVLILQWACEIDLKPCRKDALELFEKNEGKSETTPPETARKTKAGDITPADLRKIVYCEAARDNTTNWEIIWKLFKDTNSAAKKVTIITALGCSEDKATLEKYLAKSIADDSGIRAQDAYSVFTSVMTGTPKGVDIALNFLIKNYKAIRKHYTSMNALGTVITAVADRITTEAQAKEFNNFLEAEKGELDDAKDIIPAAKATVKANQKWVDTYQSILMQKFGYDAGGAGNNLISLSFSALLFLALSINYLF